MIIFMCDFIWCLNIVVAVPPKPPWLDLLIVYDIYIFDSWRGSLFSHLSYHGFLPSEISSIEKRHCRQQDVNPDPVSSALKFLTTGTRPGTGTWRRSKRDQKSWKIGIFITVLMSHGTKNLHKTWRRDLRPKRLGTTALDDHPLASTKGSQKIRIHQHSFVKLGLSIQIR